MIGRIVGLVVAGLVIGALGRLLHPGADPLSISSTILIGVVAVVGTGLRARPGGQ